MDPDTESLIDGGLDDRTSSFRSRQMRRNSNTTSKVPPIVGFSVAMNVVFFLLLLATIVVAILAIIAVDNITDDMNEKRDHIDHCRNDQDSFGLLNKMFIGTSAGNKSTIYDEDDFQRLDLHFTPPASVKGRPVWLYGHDQIWVPDTTNNVIDIYIAGSLFLLKTINTSTTANSIPACFSPSMTSYHPNAGRNGRGQVWVSCGTTNATHGWAVFDPEEQKKIAFIPKSSSLDDFIPYDVTTGKLYTVVSLVNNTLTAINGNVIQISNRNFVTTLISQNFGLRPKLSYAGNADSHLYISDYYNNEVHKVNFTSFSIEHTWTGVVTPIDLSTSPSEDTLVVISDTDSTLYAFGTYGPSYPDLLGTPYVLTLLTPQQILYSLDGTEIFITNADTSDFVTVLTELDFAAVTFTEQTMSSAVNSKYLTNIALTCWCSTCHLFRRN